MDKKPSQRNEGTPGLVIPLGRHEFGEFIAGLLGQRRLIEKRFKSVMFFIDMNWLLNLDQIINQRIAAQNEAKLVSFSARVFFHDGRIVSLPDHTAFQAFGDLSNVLTVGVDIGWTYLISFPLSSIPEKQELRFYAFTDTSALERKPDRSASKSFLRLDDRDKEETIYYSIHFSNVTWGEDLSNHISSYIETKTEKRNRFSAFLRSIRPYAVFPVFAIIGSFISMYSLASSLRLEAEGLLTKYKSLVTSPALSSTGDKINFLVDATMNRLSSDLSHFLLPLFKGLYWMTLITVAYFIASVQKTSFISLNAYSDRYYTKYNKNYEHIKYGVLLALSVAIVGGLFASRIYDAIKDFIP